METGKIIFEIAKPSNNAPPAASAAGDTMFDETGQLITTSANTSHALTPRRALWSIGDASHEHEQDPSRQMIMSNSDESEADLQLQEDPNAGRYIRYQFTPEFLQLKSVGAT